MIERILTKEGADYWNQYGDSRLEEGAIVKYCNAIQAVLADGEMWYMGCETFFMDGLNRHEIKLLG